MGHISGLVKIPMTSLIWPYQKKSNEFNGNGLHVRIDYIGNENSIRITFWTKR